jgi:hypothetical protein
LPHWRFTLSRVRVIGRDPHHLDVIYRNSRQDRLKNLGHGDHSGREIQTHQRRVRPPLGRGRVVAVSDEYL